MNSLDMHSLNEQLFRFINGAAGQSPWLDQFFVFVTHYFVYALVGVSLIWFFIIRPRRETGLREKFSTYRQALLLALSLLLTWGVVEVIKGFVAFPRPLQLIDGVHSLVLFGSYDSFPSAHTAVAFAAASFVYQYSRTTGVSMYALALLVGVSRIFVGVHFPLDVLVGALLGTSVSWGLVKLFRHYTL
jgi:undecaprenyl-diphosphatase